MQVKLDKVEISQAVADYVAKNLGWKVPVSVSFDATSKTVNGVQIGEAELFATVTFNEPQGIQEAKA